MAEALRAAVLCIGNELLDGTVVDLHTPFLGRLFAQHGIKLEESRTLGDDETYAPAILQAAERFDYVVITGGLGPTSDDRTREELSAAAGVNLIHSEDLWLDICARYPAATAASNRQQASVPEGFRPLRNDQGTAPGLLGRIGECTMIALPGPPKELASVVDAELVPLLQSASPTSDVLRSTVFGIPEAELEDALRDLSRTDLKWNTVAGGQRILLSLSGEGASGAFEALERRYGAVRVRRGRVEPGRGLLEIAESLGVRCVFAESCTGGLAGGLITAIPGSSAVFWGSLVTYDNGAKRRVLGVSQDILDRFGAVSSECAEAMAIGAAALAPDGAAVSITGIAGPDGGTEAKPVGTVWMGVARGDQRETRRFHFPGNRDRVRREAALNAVLYLEAFLRGHSLDTARG